MSKYINAREKVYGWYINGGGYPVAGDGHIFACARDTPSIPVQKIAGITKEFLNIRSLIICNGWIYANIPKNRDAIKKALDKDIKTAESKAKEEADAILGITGGVKDEHKEAM